MSTSTWEVEWWYGRTSAGTFKRGADFWRRITEQIPNPTGGPPGIPAYRAGDRELGTLYTLTGGFGIKVRSNTDLRRPGR